VRHALANVAYWYLTDMPTVVTHVHAMSPIDPKRTHGCARRLPMMRQLIDSTTVAKVGEIVECLDAWNKEIGAALHGREGWKALYPLSDRTLWDCKIKRASLAPMTGSCSLPSSWNLGSLIHTF
jgi:hypothetical protein